MSASRICAGSSRATARNLQQSPSREGVGFHPRRSTSPAIRCAMPWTRYASSPPSRTTGAKLIEAAGDPLSKRTFLWIRVVSDILARQIRARLGVAEARDFAKTLAVGRDCIAMRSGVWQCGDRIPALTYFSHSQEGKACPASSSLCFFFWPHRERMPPSADRPLIEPAASAPTERQPTTKTPGGFIPHSVTIRTKSHRAGMFRADAAIVRPRPWSRGALSSMAGGFATNSR
jgi:hypothetical protein